MILFVSDLGAWRNLKPIRCLRASDSCVDKGIDHILKFALAAQFWIRYEASCKLLVKVFVDLFSRIVFLSAIAFDLTYAPGMAEAAFKGGITLPAFAFFLFITLMSPAIDSNNGFLGQFMVLGGMYLAWTLARAQPTS